MHNPRRPVFPDIVFTQDEIENGLEVLLEENIMKTIQLDNCEIRYDLATDNLKRCLESFWSLWDSFVFDVIGHSWKFIRKSRIEERNWLKHFFLKREADKMERNYYSERLSFRKNSSEEDIQLYRKVITGKFNELERQFEQVYALNLNEKYGSPVQEFLEFLYPTSLRDLHGRRPKYDWWESLPESLDRTRALSREKLWYMLEAHARKGHGT
jgi:hypothetical protein